MGSEVPAKACASEDDVRADPSVPTRALRPTVAAIAAAAAPTCTLCASAYRRAGSAIVKPSSSRGALRNRRAVSPDPAANNLQDSHEARCASTPAASACESSPSTDAETDSRTRSQSRIEEICTIAYLTSILTA